MDDAGKGSDIRPYNKKNFDKRFEIIDWSKTKDIKNKRKLNEQKEEQKKE